MYSFEEKMRAVNLYIKYHHRAAPVIRELGFPDRHMLVKWYKQYEATGTLTKEVNRRQKFSEQQKQIAMQYYWEHGQSIVCTIRHLGYPSSTTFKHWLNEAYPERTKYCISGGAMIEYPQEKKEQAVIDLCSRAGSAKEIADQHGVSRVTLYEWKNQLLGKECSCTMPSQKQHNTKPQKNICQDFDSNSALDDLRAQTEELERQKAELERRVYQLRLENDILEKAAEIIKKGQGISLLSLTNKEKAVLIDALRDKYRLNELLEQLHMAKSSYCYQKRCLHREDPYDEFRIRIHQIFYEVGGCYGYRRIHALLIREGYMISEKVVRRIMKEDNLVVPHIKRKKYSSYVGEVSPAAENIINRDFHAELPNKKWLTDITEFGIPAGKVYLSPIVDCFDGMAVSWTIGTSPNADLANTMLDTAILGLAEDEHPIVHSDRGGHYRWPGWIERMDEAGLTRSMSKKGCSPDNSACEGFFGRIKNEMFYGRNWKGVSLETFMALLDTYLHWYNEKRIKISLGGMSPVEYRQHLGLKYNGG